MPKSEDMSGEMAALRASLAPREFELANGSLSVDRFSVDIALKSSVVVTVPVRAITSLKLNIGAESVLLTVAGDEHLLMCRDAMGLFAAIQLQMRQRFTYG